ncbi:MAG TPA: DOMON-like domain-containing protein [Candidatus Binatia bacterium]|jgi:hypothetical protein
MQPAVRSASLVPHPQTRTAAARSIDVRIASAPGALEFTYTLHGDCERIRIPAAEPAKGTDELWRHTCFEAFVGRADGGYYEFNFSPSGRWAAYRFRSYRNRTELEEFPAPEIVTSRIAESLRLDAKLNLRVLAEFNPSKIALAAVLEDTEGELGYWALRHPPGRPDFHHADNFLLDLPFASGAAR